MSRKRRFKGHKAVICISNSAGSISTSRGGFLGFAGFGFHMRSILACTWLRGIAGQKGACLCLLEEGYVRTITT